MGKLSVGIIGAGLIGGKRAAALSDAKCEAKLVAVADVSRERAGQLAQQHGAEATQNAEDLIARKDVDVVVIATTNDSLVSLSTQALRAGKHVLVEKPAGRNPRELKALVEETERSRTILRVGFNHRFHPGFQKAKHLVRSEGFGPLMYIRARYGHGGRIGYDREWRADPARAGGGELLDQGVHLIDLCRWLGGEFDLECGRVGTYFWDMPVEDNGFMLLKSRNGKSSAHLHASCTEWKNLFDFELFGRTAKVQIWGLGRSYGVEELRHYQMKPEMGPPDITTEQFPGEDRSWNLEWEAFLAEMNGQKTDIGTALDGLRAVEIVYDVYQQSKVGFLPART